MRPVKFNLKTEHLWGLIGLVGIFVFVNTHPIRPHDFWWHITIGREILTVGKIPATDIYSYTAYGQPYPSYQIYWLMEGLLYLIYKFGGPALVIFIHSLMISSAYGIIFWLCKQYSKSWRIAAFGVLFAAALGINDWNVRPQGITFLLASLVLFAIYMFNKTGRWRWLVIFPLTMLVWVNSHGTFTIGLVLVAIWFGQQCWDAINRRFNGEKPDVKKMILLPGSIFGITLLACLINPRGIGIINYLLTLTSNNAVQNLVTEWAPPTFNTLMGAIFLIGLMISAVVLAVSPQRPSFSQVITFLVFGILGLKTSRGIVWFGLVMAPILSEHIGSIVVRLRFPLRQPKTTRLTRILNLSFIFIIIAMGLISLPWFKNSLPFPQIKAGVISAETPIQATQVLLEQHPPGQVFNSISFGSYLIWAAHPQYPVFVDSRIELYPENVWMDYLMISNATSDWGIRLKDYGVNTLMLSPLEQPNLIQAVEESNEWNLLYADGSARIFTRK